MTALDVKHELDSIWQLRREIASREEHLEELRTQATHITSVLSQAKATSSDAGSKPENYAVRSYELMMDYEDKVGELYDKIKEAEALIELLDSPFLKAVMIDLHVRCIGLRNVMAKYNYSQRQLYNVRWKAYSKIATNCHT